MSRIQKKDTEEGDRRKKQEKDTEEGYRRGTYRRMIQGKDTGG